ncbi:hypothetical protein TPA0910_85220 [Streptomyces hygroscopicus subsp. sporocinereus]|uniref:Uncharacterized protein n=1 Tax=Streptomyces hygroscopicus TaxID=1912 RepID=A0ABQ3UER1_STRHY|nr:hypothetical protein TPA0910_85220 [Streptomyces hygroscopicus]
MSSSEERRAAGGTTAAIAGAEGRLPVAGLLIMSSPARCGGDGGAAVRTIEAPSLFVVSPGDMNGAVEKQVRETPEPPGRATQDLAGRLSE